MTITVNDLQNMLQPELDELYKNSHAGIIPDGESKGTVIFAPGTSFSQNVSSIIKFLAWQGKIFYREKGYLLNKITPLNIELVKAEVYLGKSWLDEGESIILDYSQTSFIAQKIRDEIREVAPNIYLGNAYWEKYRVLNFVLEF
ncbi:MULTISPECIES: hypothetical protein [unclassified Okeania]|nr:MULTISPECIES: hypothetical protein [unclassified Okeania]NES90253.1 hypothetical protein [Okeania sp. SIO2B9]NET76065.1 hypothetical protein [Okeania sp. SIO1F9]